jgi:2Fe-2S ferredoxin
MGCHKEWIPASAGMMSWGRDLQFRLAHPCLPKPPAIPYIGGTQQAPETMTKITFVQQDGTSIETEAQNGATVMETAIMNAIPGIVAECGGACTCATCHVYVDDAWTETVGGPSNMEEDMLDFAFDVKEQSRLSCQIKVKDALDGLVVHVPSRQG